MSKRKALSLENKANNISYIERGVDVCRKYGLSKSTRSSGVTPNGPVLKNEAEQLAKWLDNNKEFVCSEGWLDRWKSRHVIMAGKVRGKREDAIIEAVKDGSNTQEKECENDEDEIEESVPTVKEVLKVISIILRLLECMDSVESSGEKSTDSREGSGKNKTEYKPVLREQQFSLYLAVPPSSPHPSYLRMRTTVKHPVAETVKRTVPYKEFGIFFTNWGMATEDSDNETEASFAASDRSRHGHTHSHYRSQAPYRPSVFGSRRALYSDTMPKLAHGYSTLNVPHGEATDAPIKPEGAAQPPTELMAFIERQEEYIEQLEKESQFCREELSHLLGKVKEVISENEGLHEKEKAGLLKSVFDSYETGDDEDDHDMDSEEKSEKRKPLETKKKRLEGPSIVFESRISELEAQLTQTKLDLKKALEEADLYKKKLTDQHYGSDLSHSSGSPDSQRQQIDTLQRQVVVVTH
uniref:(California timema) hypothetical protein n=1 Tax=Timema californicum TaxID=61474 RepID=A0A7R9J358_TIMCA|nr:unnamed protein product [Timema californicum]